MRASFGISRPDDVEMTLTITMTLARWKQLRDQLQDASYPSCDLNARIGEVVAKASSVFVSDKT